MLFLRTAVTCWLCAALCMSQGKNPTLSCSTKPALPVSSTVLVWKTLLIIYLILESVEYIYIVPLQLTHSFFHQ